MLMMSGRLILASASPRRSDLLRQIGVEPEVVPSHVQERITKSEPDLVVMELSRQKAEDIARLYGREQVTVLGADTVVSVDGMILGKPADAGDAVRMLGMLQGRTHQVYTGVTLIGCDGRGSAVFAERTDVSVYPMSDGEISRYVDSGDPFDKAGAYGIQGCFAAHIRKIDGDYNNVVGLPVGRVWQELKKMGMVRD